MWYLPAVKGIARDRVDVLITVAFGGPHPTPKVIILVTSIVLEHDMVAGSHSISSDGIGQVRVPIHASTIESNSNDVNVVMHGRATPQCHR